jgi:hypothetical protein
MARPWYSMPSGPARQAAKAADKHIANKGNTRLKNLARKYGLRVDRHVRGRIDGDKLVLTNGQSRFVLTLELIDKPYLQHVLDTLNHPIRSSNA